MSDALCEAPADGRWDFGGYAYGLEPLLLPPVGTPDAVLADTDDLDTGLGTNTAYAEICERLRALGEPDALTSEVGPCDEPDELFWFRWITGHQICFVAWRLIGQLLDDVDQGRRTPEEILEPVRCYVDAYAAMLLYTGSCPPDLYAVLIRPSMRLQHRAFSGSWAPDYWPIRDLFRRRQLPPIWSTDTDTEGLRASLTLLHLVHDGVAARLVSNGRSLLREAAIRGPNHRVAWMFFDNYFMTLRAPVSRHDVISQLLRRLVAVVQDLAANGLYSPDDKDERPEELQATEVIDCENSIIDIMVATARFACDLKSLKSAAER